VKISLLSESNYVMVYSKKILEHRLKRNWTQAYLAYMSGVKQPLIARYENGANPSKKNLDKLAVAFKVPVHELMDDVVENNDNSYASLDFNQVIKASKNLPVEYKKMLRDIIAVMLRENEYAEDRKMFNSVLLKDRKP